MRFFNKQGTPRAVSAALAALVAAVLVACGGGSTQYEAYVPGQVLVVGDDFSAFAPVTAENGVSNRAKYAVNGLKADGTADCTLEPLWVQSVAGYYGYTFAECNPNTVSTFKAVSRAQFGAKVANLGTQVQALLASGGIQERDLVLAFAGVNDVLELYSRYPAETQEALVAEARARGERMAETVNGLVGLRARVIVSSLPDMGLSPYAVEQEVIQPGSAAFLSALSSAFNVRMGVKLLLDGRYIGLMQTDVRSQQASLSPSFANLTNASTKACAVPLPGCTTKTLVTDATAGGYMWADGTRFSSGGQNLLATLALDRAQRNPF